MVWGMDLPGERTEMSLQSPFYFSLRVKLHLIISPLPSSPLYLCLRNSLSQNLESRSTQPYQPKWVTMFHPLRLLPDSSLKWPKSLFWMVRGFWGILLYVCHMFLYRGDVVFLSSSPQKAPVSLRPCPWDPETQKAHTKHSKNKVKQCKVLGDWDSSKFKKSRRLKCSWFYEIYSCFFYSLHSHRSLRSLKT